MALNLEIQRAHAISPSTIEIGSSDDEDSLPQLKLTGADGLNRVSLSTYIPFAPMITVFLQDPYNYQGQSYSYWVDFILVVVSAALIVAGATMIGDEPLAME